VGLAALLGELRRLGITVSKGSVATVLARHGLSQHHGVRD